MPTDRQLLGIQVVFLILLGFFGWLGCQDNYLDKAWPHVLMFTFMVLNIIICGIIIGT